MFETNPHSLNQQNPSQMRQLVVHHLPLHLGWRFLCLMLVRCRLVFGHPWTTGVQDDLSFPIHGRRIQIRQILVCCLLPQVRYVIGSSNLLYKHWTRRQQCAWSSTSQLIKWTGRICWCTLSRKIAKRIVEVLLVFDFPYNSQTNASKPEMFVTVGILLDLQIRIMPSVIAINTCIHPHVYLDVSCPQMIEKYD